MKRLVSLVTVYFLLCVFPHQAFAKTQTLAESDKQMIAQKLDTLVTAINNDDLAIVLSLISPNRPDLQAEIQNQLAGSVLTYQLEYSPLDQHLEVVNSNTVKISARYAASGLGWNISGLSTDFTFEKHNQQWFITDTNFHQKLGPDYVWNLTKKVFLIAGPICLILGIFWLWMLIDCSKRNFKDKAVWVILLIFLNILGAILYYFLVKRKNLTSKPLRFKG